MQSEVHRLTSTDSRPVDTLVGIIHRLDELNCRHKLHPPVLLLTRQPLLIEAADVLDVGHERRDAGLDQDEDEYGHEVVGSRHRALVRHAQQVHDRRRATQHALQLVFRRLNSQTVYERQ